MKKLLLILTVSTLGLGTFGCGGEKTSNSGNSNKPSNAASNSASNAATNSNSTKKDDKPKAKLSDEKKPEGKSKQVKNNPVPESWVYVYDESKGYGFSVPDGTTGGSETYSGIDVFSATTPQDIDIFVLAYKDKTLTKDDLLADAVEFLEGLGQTVTPGKLKGESDDYAVADATTEYKDSGQKGKLRILVGTDVTDNYVMILGADPATFASNEKTIDEIWGSFEMWSGGASGGN